MKPRLATVGSAVMVAAVLTVAGLTLSGSAGAGPGGASPKIYVALGTNGYAMMTLAGFSSGPTTGSVPQFYGAKAVAFTANAADAVFACNSTSEETVAASTVYVAPTDGAPGQTASLATETDTIVDAVALADDPADPGEVFVLGSHGLIDEVDVDANPVQVNTVVTTQNSDADYFSIAVTPDGQNLLVAFDLGGEWGVEEYSAGGVPETRWVTKGLASRASVAVAPKGGAVYAAASFRGSGQVVGLQQSTSALTQSWLVDNPVVDQPASVTVSPNGQTVFVAGLETFAGAAGGAGEIQTLSAASGQFGLKASLSQLDEGANGGGPTGVAISPDGLTAVVVGGDNGDDDFAYDLSTATLAVNNGVDLGASGSAAGQSVAITPDQAPVADLDPASGTAGDAVTLNASGSTVAYGSIKTYSWNFGDGTSTTTSDPTVSHTWTSAGNYNVTLTETDSAGTSLAPAPFVGTAINGPGTTAYLDAGPQARTTAPVAIGQPGQPPPTIPTRSTTTTTTPPKGAAPVITLSPPVGSPGSVVTVTGHGFTAGKPVTVSWSTGTGSFTENANGSGNLPPDTLLILVPDLLGPRKAVATQTGKPSASAAFLVVASSAEPGSGSSFLFRSEGP